MCHDLVNMDWFVAIIDSDKHLSSHLETACQVAKVIIWPHNLLKAKFFTSTSSLLILLQLLSLPAVLIVDSSGW